MDQDCDGVVTDTGCEPVYVGEYLVSDGPTWTSNPPSYTCQEACALLFGGGYGDYACSTQYGVVDNQASSSTWGIGGCAVVAEDYELDPGTGYDCGVSGCSTSAYISDNCSGATNYCYQY